MLKNTTVLVSGASSGIGRACAELFSREGCRLILAARRGDMVEQLAAELQRSNSAETLSLELDVRDRPAVEHAISNLAAEWSDIDILLNNAGLSRGLDKLQDGDHQDWEEMIDTNIKGLLYMTRAIVPGMVARDRGHVINIGSIAGHEVYPGGNVYCGTKHAVAAITKGLRIDLLGTRVRCSTVDPGMVETEFSLVRFHGDRERADTVYQQFPPLTAEDIAETVLFCATRPPHVCISEMIVMPQDQATVYANFQRGLE